MQCGVFWIRKNRKIASRLGRLIVIVVTVSMGKIDNPTI
jgi:hypothetical protein